jgi:uncharacterized Zn-finger protein
MTKSMEEKLIDHYKLYLKMGNGGHATGFYSTIESESIQFSCQFPQ